MGHLTISTLLPAFEILGGMLQMSEKFGRLDQALCRLALHEIKNLSEIKVQPANFVHDEKRDMASSVRAFAIF